MPSVDLPAGLPPPPLDPSLAAEHVLVTQRLTQRGCSAEIWGMLSGDSTILGTFLASVAGQGKESLSL